jgi:ATP-dependent Lon protease
MAASRNGITNVILPEKNRKDADDIPEDLRSEMKIHFVERIE